jgi:uncharacterized coiled-coil DUF342 family protein
MKMNEFLQEMISLRDKLNDTINQYSQWTEEIKLMAAERDYHNREVTAIRDKIEKLREEHKAAVASEPFQQALRLLRGEQAPTP